MRHGLREFYWNLKNMVTCCLLGTFLAVLAPALVHAGEGPTAAPTNPAFLEYIQKEREGLIQSQSFEGYPLGYIPPVVKLPQPAKSSIPVVALPSLPPTYDLRITGRLTPVRDQGDCGSCWAFATYSSLESYLNPSGAEDFAEGDLNQRHGFDIPECDGGNHIMATAYLSRWDGPVDESNFPYPYVSATPGPAVQKHVQDVDFLPNRTGPLDNDGVKTAVMNDGAVYISFQWNSAYYNSMDKAFYSPVTGANHAVAIVGWDDNFSNTKFKTVPAGNGAFIVRNSWGSAWGENGYFYISYYDASLTILASFRNAEPVKNYRRAYQYDPLGWVNNFGWGGTDYTAWFSNIYKAGAKAYKIKAVGFYTATPNSTYTVLIYKNVTAGAPRSGILVKTVTGTINQAGYHTVRFPAVAPAEVTPGKKFSAVVKLTTPGWGYPIPIEYPVGGYSGAANASAGQSFYSLDGIAWTDLTSSIAKANACLKAFGGL